MGCGSSSLKGDEMGDVGGDKPQPARRVKTNFSDVDFSTGAGADRRGTMALAPDEQSRPARVSEASAEGRLDEPPSGMGQAPTQQTDGGKLAPYKSVGAEGDAMGDSSAPLNHSKVTPEISTGGIPRNEETTTLTTAGTEYANPIKASA